MNSESKESYQAVADHLRLMITKEKQSGDFLLASVVQDSLLYNLHHHADSEELLSITHAAAKAVIEVSIETMYLSESTVREAVRGATHSMLTLGEDPLLITIAVTTGSLLGLPAEARRGSAYTKAILRGIAIAADEMGLRTDVHSVPSHIVESISELSS